MSELMNERVNGKDFRLRLLTTVSALALTASIYGGQPASASDDDTDRPVVWIELGGQLERLDGSQTPFAPPFFDTVTKGGLVPPLVAGKPSIYSNGGEGTISFMPDGSDWVFSGSVRYGRSNGRKFVHQQFKGLITQFTLEGYHLTKTAPPRYEQTVADNSETHVIVDFQAGKDVGMGLFGGTSTVSAGLRFAQFSAKSDVTIHAQPDAGFALGTVIGLRLPFVHYHQYFGSAQRAASFKGIGPSLSWNGSTPLHGNSREGEIALDWGMNAAILFGSQKAREHHRSSGSYQYHVNGAFSSYTFHLPTHHGTGNRSRSVVVPNVGGFASLSMRYLNTKASLGYRGDLFFGAMDGGLRYANLIIKNSTVPSQPSVSVFRNGLKRKMTVE